MYTLLIVSLLSLVFLALSIVALFYLRNKVGEARKDDLRYSSLPIIYTLTAKFIAPSCLDNGFYELYANAIRERVPNASEDLIKKYSSKTYKCVKASNLMKAYLKQATRKRNSKERANIVARAITLALKIDSSNYFTKGLNIPGSIVANNYKDYLKVLKITNDDVKQALLERASRNQD